MDWIRCQQGTSSVVMGLQAQVSTFFNPQEKRLQALWKGHPTECRLSGYCPVAEKSLPIQDCCHIDPKEGRKVCLSSSAWSWPPSRSVRSSGKRESGGPDTADGRTVALARTEPTGSSQSIAASRLTFWPSQSKLSHPDCSVT